MVISIAGALIIFNVTEGNSYFQDLTEHNLSQARDRINEWKQGRQIRGRNEWRTFAIEWKDVTKIAIISVVDGPHALCMRHDLKKVDMDSKVTLCATFTSDFLRCFSELGGGARDLVNFSNALYSEQAHTGAVAASQLQHAHEMLMKMSGVLDLPIVEGPFNGSFSAKEWGKYYTKFFQVVRESGDVGSDVVSDLSWAEIIRAIASIGKHSAEMTKSAMGQLRMEILGDKNRLLVAITNNFPKAAERTDAIIAHAKEHRCNSVYLVSLNYLSGPSLYFTAEPLDGSATEWDLKDPSPVP